MLLIPAPSNGALVTKNTGERALIIYPVVTSMGRAHRREPTGLKPRACTICYYERLSNHIFIIILETNYGLFRFYDQTASVIIRYASL